MTRLFIADASVPSGALGAVLAATRLWRMRLEVDVECVCDGFRTGFGGGGGAGCLGGG